MKKALALTAFCAFFFGCLKMQQKTEEKFSVYYFSLYSLSDTSLINEADYPKLEEQRLWTVGYGHGYNEEMASKLASLDAALKLKALVGKDLDIYPAAREVYKQVFWSSRKHEKRLKAFYSYKVHKLTFAYLYKLSNEERAALESKLQQAKQAKQKF